MKILKIYLVGCILLMSHLGRCQDKCFEIDKYTYIAYHTGSRDLYSGECETVLKNGQKQAICNFHDGIIQYSIRWDKKGTIIDSTVYLKGYTHYEEFSFYKDGMLKHRGKWRLDSANKSGVPNYKMYGIHTSYYKNGKIESEIEFIEVTKKSINKIYKIDGSLLSVSEQDWER